MAGESSEEKKHPASDMKIQRLRREGQVASSKDFVTGLTTCVFVAVVYFMSEDLSVSLKNALLAALALPQEDFSVRLRAALDVASSALVQTVFVPGAIAALLALIIDVLDKRGIVISKKAGAPDFKNLNPVQGIQKLFKMRTGVELLKTLAKATLFVIAAGIVVVWTANDLFWAPTCGEACVARVAVRAVTLLVALSCAILLIVGVIDLRISRAVFKHEQRMTDTEVKRETKENFGAPEIRQARQELRQSTAGLALGKLPKGDAAITLVIEGPKDAVALHYDGKHFEIPLVLEKARGPARRRLLERAASVGAPAVRDDALAAALGEGAPIRNFIPAELFDPVAMAMARSGVI